MAPCCSTVARCPGVRVVRDRSGGIGLGEQPHRFRAAAIARQQQGAAGGLAAARIRQQAQRLEGFSPRLVRLLSVRGQRASSSAGFLDTRFCNRVDGRGHHRFGRGNEQCRQPGPQGIGGRLNKARGDRPPEADHTVAARRAGPLAQHLQGHDTRRLGQIRPRGGLGHGSGVFGPAQPKIGVQHASQQR